MHKATEIRLRRAEGPTRLCDGWHGFKGPDVWGQARAWLWAASSTAPRTGGYDKIDFVVTWEDGETYTGVYDLTHPSVGGAPSLPTHMRAFLRFYAGEVCPPHLTRAQYEGHLARVPDVVAAARAMLVEREVG